MILLQSRRSRRRTDCSLNGSWRSTHSRGRRRRRVVLCGDDICSNSILANGLICQLVLGGVHEGGHYRVRHGWGGRSQILGQRHVHDRRLRHGGGHWRRGREYRGGRRRWRWRWRWMDLKPRCGFRRRILRRRRSDRDLGNCGLPGLDFSDSLDLCLRRRCRSPRVLQRDPEPDGPPAA